MISQGILDPWLILMIDMQITNYYHWNFLQIPSKMQFQPYIFPCIRKLTGIPSVWNDMNFVIHVVIFSSYPECPARHSTWDVPCHPYFLYYVHCLCMAPGILHSARSLRIFTGSCGSGSVQWHWGRAQFYPGCRKRDCFPGVQPIQSGQ